MCALLAKVVVGWSTGVNVAVAVALACGCGSRWDSLRQPARHFDHHACKASGAQSNPAAGMRALICDDRTHLESNILIMQHDGDCHFVWWWLIRSGTCGNRRKSKPGPERAFFGSLRHLLSRLSYGGRNYSTCSQLGKNHFALLWQHQEWIKYAFNGRILLYSRQIETMLCRVQRTSHVCS